MEAQQQQPQLYEYQQYQHQTQVDTNPTSQPYDSSSSASQIQSYDPQSYYASYPQHYTTAQQPYQTQDPYSTYSSSSYYYPNYSTTSYQTQDPNSVHPPGVPVSADPQQTQNLYSQSPQTQGYFQPGQPVYGTGSSQGGRSTRGGGRGRRGRGRGGGRGPVTASAAPQAAPSKPPPQMAWCELCRVDCNTQEILEKHKNGKKHLKNLKTFEAMQNEQISMTQPQSEAAQESDTAADKTVAQPSEEGARQDSNGGRGGGLKRKMGFGRGGAKWVRSQDGSKRLVPPKPKQMVHLLCELCNVKCESQVVYESHVAGKKHLSNLKRYQGHKETFGEGQIGALYPTIPNVVPLTTSIVPPQGNQLLEVPQDAQALASMMLSHQNLPDPQAAQAALAQLLAQHGVHDAQTLLVQLIPYLLTQPQVPGSVPALPVAGLGMNDPYLPSQGPPVLTEAAGQNEGQNGQVVTEQQNLASNGESEAGVGTSEKADDGPTEAGKVGAE